MKNNSKNINLKTKNSNDFYILLATVPNPKGSMRCGKGSCEHYDKHNKISGCKLFDDRRKCIRSNKQRKSSANTSKRRGDTTNWYCC